MNQQPKTLQTILLVAVLALVLVVLSSSLLTQNGSRLAYSDVLDLFENERVESFVLQGDTLTLTLYGSDAEQAGTATAKIGDIETFHKDLDETIAAQSAAGVLKSYNYLPAANSIWKTVLPYLLYTNGLARVESGKASILASLEPVVASFVGILAFGEPMSLMVFLGLGCILACVYVLR